MQLTNLVGDDVQRNYIASIVWKLFDSTPADAFKVKVLFFSFNLREPVRQWIISKFGPDPVTVEIP